MDPYIPYEFDITSSVRQRSNIISLHVWDLATASDDSGLDQIALGVNPGWEAYGGIIRDVWIEIRPSTFINAAQFEYTLKPNFEAAECTVRVEIHSNAPVSGHARVTVSRGAQTVGQTTQPFSVPAGRAEVDLPVHLSEPALWSPESPDLYDVSVFSETRTGIDEFAFRTGLRQFLTNGRSFELNGKRILLHGVCRHDMWKDQGFTLSREQMKRDMQAIKSMGLNFVRLVHYPHHRYIIELADELGLMVTEEPGFWNMDFHKMRPSMIDLGLRILEQTIRRDTNSPSVVAWLLANECTLTVDYLNRGKALCRKLDPIARLVSAANSMPMEKAKPIFEEAGLEFFDDHPYTFDVDAFRRIADFYGDSRPLMFTEWGGKEIGNQPQVMSGTVDAFIALEESGRLAGTSFWSWQDVPQFSRIDAEMRHGILESGVVTESRDARQNIVMELRRMCEGRSCVEPAHSEPPQIVALRRVPWSPGRTVKSIDLANIVQSGEQTAAWKDFERILAEYWAEDGYARDQWVKTGARFRLWRANDIEILGVPFRTGAIDDFVRPVVITPAHPKITCPVGLRCSGLHILGHISCPDGYPALGENGERGAILRLQFEDGRDQVLPLLYGYELARGNMIYSSSRVDPIVINAQRALQFNKDTEREVYQVLLYSVPLGGQNVQSLTYELQGRKQPILLFAINAEIA
jgi:hypothetical protein